MRYFSYVVSRDFGFAPNPFNGICTLATCKPNIRQRASIGDWVLGTGSARYGTCDRLVFAMKISEKITYNDYWNDERFEFKKPVMNGSLKKMYGDNIYHHDGNSWNQLNSHHSLESGGTNYDNLNRDTSVDSVLISSLFYYFGKKAIEIPLNLKDNIIKRGPAYRNPSNESGDALIKYLSDNFQKGYIADPELFVDTAVSQILKE